MAPKRIYIEPPTTLLFETTSKIPHVLPQTNQASVENALLLCSITVTRELPVGMVRLCVPLLLVRVLDFEELHMVNAHAHLGSRFGCTLGPSWYTACALQAHCVQCPRYET